MTSLNPNVNWCLVDRPIMEGLSPINHLDHDIVPGLQPASSYPTLVDEMGSNMSPPYDGMQTQEGPVTLQFGEVTPLGAACDTHLCLPAAIPDGFGQWFLFNDEISLAPRMSNSSDSEAQNPRNEELITPSIGQRKRLSRRREPRQGTQPLPETDRTNGAGVSESTSHYMAKRKKHLESNRQAAKRCRENRKSRDAALESAFNAQSAHNSQLLVITNRLRSELFVLRNEILRHSLCQTSGLKGIWRR
ncbi:transcriptional regulator family: bZIP [Penicillium roqueforti]|nr:transcriptional regulator family: bZIP [Penicillium roqueforti]KAI3183670.1 transcriptional regulator family: bZIP [Penicillium roqueforti]